MTRPLYRTTGRKPAAGRRPHVCRTTPTTPGKYYWSEWRCVVSVYRKRGGTRLYVTPPGGVEILVSPRIAGTFRHVKEA